VEKVPALERRVSVGDENGLLDILACSGDHLQRLALHGNRPQVWMNAGKGISYLAEVVVGMIEHSRQYPSRESIQS
jgi:hypothetical protein